MPPKHTLPHFTITTETIQIKGRKESPLATIHLQFSVGTRQFHITGLEERGSTLIGKTNDPAVTVEIVPFGRSVSVELKGPFTGTDSVVYFSGSEVACLHGRAFVPDADCRLFVTRDKEDFYLTNTGMILQQKVNKQDLWMIAPPPHVFSFGDDVHGWFGFSIPEPLPVEFTQLSCHNRVVSLSFASYSPGHDAGRLPRVFIDAGLAGSKEILDRHCTHAGDLGLIDKTKKTYSWWYNPIYCTWGDQCYLQKTDPKPQVDPIVTPLDEQKIMQWADGIRKIYAGEVNYIVDAGWFDYLGDYSPAPAGFKTLADFQAMLAKLKADGFRTILWYTPFWVQPGAKVEQEHPEYLLRRRDGSIYRDKDNRAFLDFSHPGARDYTKGLIEFLLKTLNADGFKIDMNYVHPLMTDITLHDSAWGYGNQLWVQVAKFIHTTATAIKEDAFLTMSGIESYLQPYTSAIRLNDLFDFHHAGAWYDRAELVTRLMPDVPLDVDGWPSSVEKMREYQFVSPVFGAPVTYYIEAVDIMTVKLTEADYHRMASVWHVYSKVPCEHGMQVKIDGGAGVFERRDAHGKMKAMALQKSALACFATDKIYLTANCDRAVSFPVESADKYSRAEKVYRDGRREPASLFKDGGNLVLNVADAGSGVLCYEIS
ncbi:MAG: TIM-barrel domain-containing protein [Chthoniobacteraceae bacterium]